MTQRTVTYLKSVFETGDTPTGADYADIFDSFLPLSTSGKQTLDISLEITGDFTAQGNLRANNMIATNVSASAVYANDLFISNLFIDAVNASACIKTEVVSASSVYATKVITDTVSASSVYASNFIGSTVSADNVYANKVIVSAVSANKSFANNLTATTVSASSANITASVSAASYYGNNYFATSAYHVGSNQVVGKRMGTIANPTGGVTVDTQARTAISEALSAMRTHGLIST